jgi:predicted O-methyltransferase YrrM
MKMMKTGSAHRKFLAPLRRPLRLSYLSVTLFNWYFRPKIALLVRKTFGTGEDTNFTYDLTQKNLRYLAHTIALVTDQSADKIAGYILEAREDTALKAHLNSTLRAHGLPSREDVDNLFGRRLGWYALVRALRPRIVVETGVDKGHGSILLCAALLRNAAEGHAGEYFGLDIAPTAGWLLSGEYARTGKILYGDSLRSLENFEEPIDMFINDSDHSADYESREYQTVQSKLAPGAIVLGDNSHATDRLCKFSEETGRRFIFFREEPADHWYPGAGIGISF